MFIIFIAILLAFSFAILFFILIAILFRILIPILTTILIVTVFCIGTRSLFLSKGPATSQQVADWL